MVVVGTPALAGGTVVIGGSAVPITQVFSPPKEIILNSQSPSQVFTPPAVTRTTRVVRTVIYTPPPRSGNLPFTGTNTALGLIAGFALICGGGLLLLRRRDELLDRALAEQASALRALIRL